MTKVKVTLNKNINKRLKLRISSAISKSNFDKILLRSFKTQVRKFNFGGLSNSTIRNRRRMSQYNTTHREYSARRDNLTFSGQLVDSFKSRWLTSKFAFRLQPDKRRHKKYKTSKKARRGGSRQPTNREIMEHQNQKGREMADVFTDDFNRKLSKFLTKILKRHFRLK